MRSVEFFSLNHDSTPSFGLCQGRVFSLNHDTTMSFGLCHNPISQNLAPTCTGISVLGCAHMPLHSIWSCSNTLSTTNMDVGCSQWGLSASTPQHHYLGSAVLNFPKFGTFLHRYNCVMMCLMPIHSIWRCSNASYTSNMDVGCSQWGFSASIMTPQHHYLGSAILNFPIFGIHKFNTVMVHPYAHPQHMKVL